MAITGLTGNTSIYALNSMKNGVSDNGAVYAGNLKMLQNMTLESTQEKLARQEKLAGQVEFWENQKANLKNVECDSLEDIANKLDMIHQYEDEIAAAKMAYNNEQMFHVLDEAKELGEKIAEEAEKKKPKTKEERKEELLEEITETEDGLLEELLEETTQMVEELQEELQEELPDETICDTLEELSDEAVRDTFEEMTEQMKEMEKNYRPLDIRV